MNTYEGMFLIDSATAKDAENWNNVTSHVSDILTKNGAEIIKTEKWGERKLAYDISGCKRGAYLLVHFNAPGSTIAPLKRDCQLSETVLRTLVVVDEDGDDADVTAASAEGAEVHVDSARNGAVSAETEKTDDEGSGLDKHEDEDESEKEATEDQQDAETEAGAIDESDRADAE